MNIDRTKFFGLIRNGPFPMTPNSMVIDLSHFNTVHDFAAVKNAGVVGVIHKATQGIGVNDPLYPVRRKAATDAGLLWGAYHFNTGDTIAAQVQHFLDAAKPDVDTLMALDFEDNSHSEMSLDQARQFLTLLEQKLGRSCVLYSGNRVKDLLGNNADPALGARRLWLPQYGPVPKPQASWKKPWLWQWTEHGVVPGITGNVDCNHFDGTADELGVQWTGAAT